VRDRRQGKGSAMNATLIEMAVATERRVIDLENAKRVARGEMTHFESGRKPSTVSRALDRVRSAVGREG